MRSCQYLYLSGGGLVSCTRLNAHVASSERILQAQRCGTESVIEHNCFFQALLHHGMHLVPPTQCVPGPQQTVLPPTTHLAADGQQRLAPDVSRT
jgi:hypothetical protein